MRRDGERTLEAFYECLQPVAAPFMALFGRERLPHRSTLSRFLAAATSKLLSRHCARCFSTTCWLGLWRRRKKQVGCGIDRETVGWCSTLMAHDKPPANELCPVHLISHLHTAAWTRSVLQATRGASEGRPSEPGPPCFRP